MKNQQQTCPMCRYNYATEEHAPEQEWESGPSQYDNDYYEDDYYEYQMERRMKIANLSSFFDDYEKMIGDANRIWNRYGNQNEELVIEMMCEMYERNDDAHNENYFLFKKDVEDMCRIIRRTYYDMHRVVDMFDQIDSAYAIAEAIYVAILSTQVNAYNDFKTTANKFIEHLEHACYGFDL
jgi:hypothetical protein